MKTFLPLLLVAFFAFSCSNDDDNNPMPSVCDFDTIISAELYTDAPSDGLTIDSMAIEGDCLTINFTSSGCDGSTWVVKLIDSEAIDESNPPQRTLRLSLDNPEVCLAIVPMELSFDISNLQLEGGSVLLNIANSGESILYTY